MGIEMFSYSRPMITALHILNATQFCLIRSRLVLKPIKDLCFFKILFHSPQTRVKKSEMGILKRTD